MGYPDFGVLQAFGQFTNFVHIVSTISYSKMKFWCHHELIVSALLHFPFFQMKNGPLSAFSIPCVAVNPIRFILFTEGTYNLVFHDIVILGHRR